MYDELNQDNALAPLTDLGMQRAAHPAALVARFPSNYRSASCCAASRATIVRVIPALQMM